jgi:type I restriction enzyme S subunit
MGQVRSLKTGIKYKETPVGKIPVDWEIMSLSKFSEIYVGQSPSSEYINQEGKGLPFYKSGAEFGWIYPMPHMWCNRPKKVVHTDDILISIRKPVGAINIAPHQCCIGSGIAAAKTKEVPHRFLLYALLLNRKILSRIAQEKSFGFINKKELSDLLIALPPLHEQKKISEILETVDDNIERTREIIEKLKKLKKGIINHVQKGQKEGVEISSATYDLIENESNYDKHLETLRAALLQVLLTGKIRIRSWPNR